MTNLPKSYRFEAPPPSLAAASDQTKTRTFSGTAYAGGPLREWGSPIVIDLESLILPPVCPVLEGHDREKRVGVCSLSVQDGRLMAAGRLLSNEDAQSLAADADEGFPWQMSVHAEPGRVEEIAVGASFSVNGRALTGPLIVLRDTLIRELSFTPTGVDAATEARVLSAEVPSAPNPKDLSDMPTIEELHSQLAIEKARAEQAEAQVLQLTARAEQAEQDLAAVRAGARKAAVLSLFAELGRPCPEAALPHYLALSEDAFGVVAADLRAAKPHVPGHLFSEQATGEPGSGAAPGLSLSAIYQARRPGVN